MVTCIFVQVKNRMDSDPGYPETATTFQRPEATGIQIAQNLPYLSLYMSFGPNSSIGGLNLEMPRLRIHETRNAKFTALQACIAVFTISERVYKCLDPECAQLLQHINRCWIDPMTLHDSADDRPLLANMLPCQHYSSHEPTPARTPGISVSTSSGKRRATDTKDKSGITKQKTTHVVAAPDIAGSGAIGM